ncbi:hypothetical protein ACFWR6_06515 [Streptomyces griseus]
MTTTAPQITRQPEDAYRALLGHTLTCPECGTGAGCPTRRRLQRSWRRTR